ncbi:FRG domain-containing protein [Roseivirga pacifica]|uniref:FRG domain-containing protein n=1 Tax=Roseivirga pacifica TaxID=1267423 RepID=UPI0020954ABC|nr:FRG domain-containing protein [Roseivirga pacifica]MCO6360026.1 FRG domain-containing protein [Roseivirga pacifica]MCO6367396.1 FRG domain-containing protein [Roseivirga pacifica]MCO6370073.1 FRG domain-containing protein [Roseivirga pacifica]MCO6375053.1 FRG domain-containing protein [Roseivirga pacifica]MCO6380311.1 FRG domain-containing protein [Roseivirga pacifica]
MSYYKIVNLDSWNDFKKFATSAKLEYIYRGENDSKWDLKSSLDRSSITFDEYEEGIINDFKRSAKFYMGNEALPNSLLGWYSLIQHYGAPSRLLDFSKSPYVAAYFAFEEASSSNAERVGIWVINKIILFQKALNHLKLKPKRQTTGNRYAFQDEDFQKVIDMSQDGNTSCIFPTEPFFQNQRYHLQQSIFLAQSNPFIPLYQQLSFIPSDIIHKAIKKITIPTSEKNKAIQDMIKMNITRATLFPGLDGYAKSLSVKYQNLLTMGEIWDSKTS